MVRSYRNEETVLDAVGLAGSVRSSRISRAPTVELGAPRVCRPLKNFRLPIHLILMVRWLLDDRHFNHLYRFFRF